MIVQEKPWTSHEQMLAVHGEIPTTSRILAVRVMILSLLSAFGPLTYAEMHAVRRQVVTSYVFT